MTLRAFRSTVLLGLLCFCAHAADLAIGGGAGPVSGNARTDPTGADARPAIGGTLLLNAGFEFLHLGSTAIGAEAPLAFHGSRSSDIAAFSTVASLYTERITAVLTPGIRVRFARERRLSPWVSFGAGVAVIHRTGHDFAAGFTGASQIGSSRVLALAPAAGVDMRITRRWFLRGELRNYLYQTPATGFVSSFAFWNRWNYNPVAAASVGFRP